MRRNAALRTLRTLGGGILALGGVWGLLYGIGRLPGVRNAGRNAGSARRGAERISSRPVNFAHRGDSSRAPENTLESFALGVVVGAGGLEMDAQLTADGHVVVIHDDTLDRISDGSGFVENTTLEDLKKRDAGYRFTLDGREFPYRGKGVRVSTLAEIYEKFPDAWINIEIKSKSPEAPERMMKAILAADAADRTVVAASDHAVMKKFRNVSGGRVATSASVREIYAFYFASRLGLEYLLPVEYVALQVPARTRTCEVVTLRFVAAAKARGVAVDVWTINEPEEMHRLLELGVDTIMTDRPGVLDAVLRGRSGG